MFLHQQLAADGSTALGRIVASKAILDFVTADSVVDVAVADGGSGYVVGETFDIDGGTAVNGFVARGMVTAESAGVVTACVLISGGAYSVLPGVTAQTTSNASLSGTGLTVDLTTDTAKWTLDRSTYTDDLTDFEWLVSSVKASNPPTVGLLTQTSNGNGYVNLQCATGFDNGQQFDAQPGAAPAGKRLLTPDTDPEIYISSTERRINIMIRDGNFVQYGTIGLFIPYTDTEAAYPFPGAVFGQCVGSIPFATSMVRNQNEPFLSNGGVVNAVPVRTDQAANSPYVFRDNLSPQWLVICENTQKNPNLRAQIWPAQQRSHTYDFDFAPEVSGWGTDPFADSAAGIQAGILADADSNSIGWFTHAAGGAQGIQGVAPLGLGGRLSLLVQPHIIANQVGDTQIVGIVDGYLAVHGRGLTSFEEIELENGERYIVFPDTNSSDLWRWVAMEIV